MTRRYYNRVMATKVSLGEAGKEFGILGGDLRREGVRRP